MATNFPFFNFSLFLFWGKCKLAVEGATAWSLKKDPRTLDARPKQAWLDKNTASLKKRLLFFFQGKRRKWKNNYKFLGFFYSSSAIHFPNIATTQKKTRENCAKRRDRKKEKRRLFKSSFLRSLGLQFKQEIRTQVRLTLIGKTRLLFKYRQLGARQQETLFSQSPLECTKRIRV